MIRRFSVEGGEVVLLGTVQGLVAEADRVREAFLATAPSAVALGLSPEAVGALLRHQPDANGQDPFEDLPDAEYAYSQRLARYGEVALPPPDLVEAVRLAREGSVGAFGVDLSEEQYEDVFTHEVGAFALLRYGRVQRTLARKPPEAPDARAFSLAWDARVRRIGALARVEGAREESIARGARAVAKQAGGRVLLVVDAPREQGVAARFVASGSSS